ncbi:MAG TPA: hypothetical protein VMS17_14720 [Gemmataceae bacterium]|nr:hypothetical protein [Gemmataceae bacterium]
MRKPLPPVLASALGLCMLLPAWAAAASRTLKAGDVLGLRREGLRQASLVETKATDNGAAELRKGPPACKITC